MSQLNSILSFRKFRSILMIAMMVSCYFKSLAQIVEISVTATSTISCSDDGTITLTVANGVAPYDIELRRMNFKESERTITNTNSTIHTLNNLANGYYNIYVKDALGHSGYYSIEVKSQFDVTTSSTPETCSSDGSATANPIGGTAPYTYIWSNGGTTKTINNISAGMYDLVVTDANGCKHHEEDTIFVPDVNALQLSLIVTHKSCLELGSASVTPNGGVAPYTYYWNTTPVQTTSTASNLLPGNYLVKVTDANGCNDQLWVYIGEDNNTLKLTTTHTNEKCGSANGTASVNVGNGTAPFTYEWSNGQTTKTAVNLDRGWYEVKVKDANSCFSTSSVFVDDSSTLKVNFTKTVSACGANDGAIYANVTGGVSPYTFAWSNGQTTQSISGLPSGGYLVNVKDATGCSIKGMADLYNFPDCMVLISGTVYNDLNGNCIKDAGENGVAGAVISISNGWSTISGVDGYYAFWITPGNYTLTQISPVYYAQKCPVSPNSITVNATTAGITYENNNFGNEVIQEVVDLAVDIFCGAPRPGFTRSSTLTYWNNGTVATSGTIEYTFSGPWNYSYASPAASSYDPITKKAVWNLSSIPAGANGYISIYMSVDPSVAIGVQVACEANISSSATETLTYNNISGCNTVTVGSYDPNDIQVFPKGDGTAGYIAETDTLLTYLIRFQNTGSDTAYTVVVRDTLDMNLTKESIQSVTSSHPCKVEVKGNVVYFTFNDIDLLDSTFNEAKSHGFVSFKILRSKDMIPGEEVKNKSDIYFDYNPPVPTNRVKNTIDLGTTGTASTEENDLVSAYPMPFNDHLTVGIKDAIEGAMTVKLITLSGEDLGSLNESSINGSFDQMNLDLSSYQLKAGVYILKMITPTKVYYKKIIKGNN